MKGYSAAVPPCKRRWRGPTVVIGALVFFSLLVPLSFLLGFHNRFPSGFLADDRLPLAQETSFGSNGRVESVQEYFEEITEEEAMRPADSTVYTKNDAVSLGKPAPSSNKKDSTYQFHPEKAVSPIHSQIHLNNPISPIKKKDYNSHGKVMPTPQIAKAEFTPSINTKENFGGIGKGNLEVIAVDGIKKSCQLEFGSYCLWSTEHKETMKDSMVKRLKDQLFVARAYYPSIAKLKAQESLTRELKQNIQDHEKILSDAISDADLPPFVAKKIRKMDETIAKAKQCSIDCSNVDRKLRQILDLAENEVHFHMKQSAFLYNLGVQTMPKSLHCLFMRLTVEWFSSSSEDRGLHAQKIGDPSFRHYVVFSRNVLAASVTINSTVMNSEATENMVFHLITDKQNYYAMKYWFKTSSFKEAFIHVINIDKFKMVRPHSLALPPLSFSEEFRITMHNMNKSSTVPMKTEYMSVFGHSHFLLAEIFKNLKRVVVLDDDMVVQQDLSPLWNLDMEGKVVGAVESCGMTLDHLKAYMPRNKYDPDSCVWMSGLNVVDLAKWREKNVTGIYNKFIWKMKITSEASWRASMLPASLMAFQNLVYPLDSSWTLSGLGYDYRISAAAVKDAATLHYNGNMKPWLELGIPIYKRHWKKFLMKGDRFMNGCNVNL
ncbi:probable galacturonosyltransferase 7 isoform X2 [Dendrobium catenatum]|uniref:probable galacturonosyltransferase 7 isoform X2 n=1 Tax=Dendrobium catenatum TaxID=906689 RepID=UPI0009F71094|nr:probable galacturonosyltransferase 7 isoform X2 [Dendrobium catenatum]